MIFKLYGTDSIPKDKAATFNYKPFESDNIAETVKFVNTHAVIPCAVNNGHRLTDNITEIYNWIRLDVDVEGEAEKIDKALKNVFYIKKPSTSHKKNPYKWHYLVPVDNISQNYDAYKLQYYNFLSKHGIELKDKSLASVVQNTNPMGEEGIELTYVNKKGKVWTAPHIKPPKRKKLKEKHSKVYKNDIQKALKIISPDIEYQVWLSIGMALYDWCPKRGFKLFDKWSKGSEKYDGTTRDKWDDFSKNLKGDLTIGSLFYLAYGEKQDPTELFGNEKGNVLKIDKETTSLDDIFGDTYMTLEDYQNIEDQKYLIDGFIPDQGFGILAGKESSGKSWITFYLSNLILEKYVDNRISFFDIDAGAVYSKSRSTYLINKYGLERFKYYSQHKGENAHDLKVKLQNASQIDLTGQIIIVDSLIGLTDGKLNGSEDIKPVLNIMEKLRNAGATVILIHHEKKDGGYAGSFAIGGAVDFMYGVSKDNDTITLDLRKDRGKYQAHTIKVTNFDTCEGEEIAYISGDVFKAEEERKLKVEEQRIKDEEYIRAITDVIKYSKARNHKPNKDFIASEVFKELGTNRKTTFKILNRYKDDLWEVKITKNKGKPGRPSMVYKLL